MTRFGWVMLTTFAALGTAISAAFHPLPRLIWNASASVPIGLYAVRPAGVLHIAELVIVRPPISLATFMDQRRYLPIGVPMLKRVAALPGQTVCRVGHMVTVDGASLGEALDRDRRGRPLPVWEGCQRVGIGEIFLMNWRSEDSLDSRYFGPLAATTIIGRADPLWIPEEH
jgi:conjugative transfer signal peptidase TraF